MTILATNTTPRVGDIIFTRWPELSSRVTCALTGDRGKAGRAAHQEMIDNVCAAEGPRVLAASAEKGKMKRWTWPGRKDYFSETKTEWSRWTRLRPFLPAETEQIQFEAEKQFNMFSYSKSELPLQGIDAIRARILGLHPEEPEAIWARKLGDWWKGGVICSKAGNLPFIRIKIFPDYSRFWSPSDTYRYIDSGVSGWGLAEHTPGW